MGTTKDYCSYVKALVTPYLRVITGGEVDLTHGPVEGLGFSFSGLQGCVAKHFLDLCFVLGGVGVFFLHILM